MRFSPLALLVSGVLVGTAAAATPQAVFIGLGDLPGGDPSSNAAGLSGDGTTVVGTSQSSNGPEAYRWTDGLGMVGIGDLSSGKFSSAARNASHNGVYVCGSGTAGVISNPITLATRWDATNGFVQLGSLNPSGFKFSVATGSSADGTKIVGSSSSPTGFRAFLWTASGPTSGSIANLGTLVPTPTLSGDKLGRTSAATAINPSGTHIVGNSGYSVIDVTSIDPPPIIIPAVNPETGDPILDANGNPTYVSYDPPPYDVETTIEQGSEAFVWTSGGGMVGLGDIAGGILGSAANGVSSDGSVVVGSGQGPEGQEAVIWVDGVLEVVGDFEGGQMASQLLDVTADGTIGVGQGTTANGPAALIWSEAFGIGNLNTLLTDQGLDMEGWVLTEATAISDDGQVIVGNGINPDGNPEAWRITEGLSLVNILIPPPPGLQESMKIVRGKAATFTAERGRVYQLLESPNLSTWTPAGPLYSTANAGDSFDHALPIEGLHDPAFYLLGPSADPSAADTDISIVEGTLLQYASARGYVYRAEYSDDFITWTPFGDPVDTSSDQGEVDRVFVDTSAATDHEQRFYRISTIPTGILTVPFDTYIGNSIGVTAPLGQDYQIQRSTEFNGSQWVNHIDYGPVITAGNSAQPLRYQVPIQPFVPGSETYRIVSLPSQTVQLNGLLSPGDGAVISFTSQPGSSYQVQRSTDGTTFTSVGALISTVGDAGPVGRMVLDAFDSTSPPPNLSHRVVEIPVE